MLEASILLEDATDSTKHPSGEIVNRFAHKLLDKEGELCYYFTQPLTCLRLLEFLPQLG